MREETRILQAIPVDELTGAVSTPIYQTATFVHEMPGVTKGFDYSRTNNPTRLVLENLLAELEGGHSGYAFASGVAAIDAVMKLLRSGDEIVAVDDIYGGTFRLFNQIYDRFNISVNYVDTTDLENVRAAVTSKTKIVWLETPTNPTLRISDISAIAEIAHAAGALLVVDNTFASPALQKPIQFGADIIVHSATKYLAGHCDVIAGAVVVNSEALGSQFKFIQNATGGVLGPFDSWLVIRGIETLALRTERISENALKLARFLEQHEAVGQVNYPGLEAHPNHELAKKQQRSFGGVISFTLKSDSVHDAIHFVSNSNLFNLTDSVGGVKSSISHPVSMSHKSMTDEARAKAGITDSLIRLSVGIEHADDLIEDLKTLFDKLEKFAVTVKFQNA
ncbi:MAG: PLP-dependent aspartate aminotransferase family protein [Chitinophagales bacterium]|nr:PLP-dependent aspartate aminotransferase family protein [Chitinophagales bacterium]